MPALMAALSAGQTERRRQKSKAALEYYSSANVRIREKCAKDWPTDFTMRAHCEGQQKEAGEKLSQRTIAEAKETWTIRNRCQSRKKKTKRG